MSLLAGITSPKNVSAQVSNIILGNGSQCGLSISGGYSRQENKSENFPSNNNNNNNIFQIVTTLNTNPCANQRDLEIIRQDSEKQREIIRQDSEKQREIIRQDNEKQREAMRTYSQIINTCINARSQAIQKEINPDVICNLRELVSELSNFSPILNSK
ncbi:hypothetical protein MEO40_15670 [Dolichospermum sp. ST_sed1]|nr:hypothetical protein [Dolichospermum sp. ST_sed1]MDD1432175.1 hypothetical protein [Dolichospermum sp. ST_sed6]MDD1440026.1 hypothetical protein [Dolichospermum sp. ST_sed3]MDD1444603.1 hypothetical protein [Dolichospermum sp. ST_sed8]MDD1458086.1 hypothetical protein [Dolichospermum sp. ST_sed7]MDD1459032.1 hypothetical protein [Dolichospermum sp. ST_sed2]